jgi:histidine decarboxylase
MLEQYKQKLETYKHHHFGYPYNAEFSFSQFSFLLDYFINNLGDPYIPSNYKLDSREFEIELIKYFATLWQFDDYWGYLTSSGTEGNLAGLLYGKLMLNNPIVYYSADTHYSVGKGCMAYSLDSIVVRSLSNGEIDYQDLERCVSQHREREAIVICNISTTFRGAYDSPSTIRRVLASAGVTTERAFIHGDGALGGMILPFLDNVHEDYQISSEHLDSISVSGHKMPGVPVPCGIIITKKNTAQRMGKHIEYLNSTDTTLNGSRNGLAAILLHQSIHNKSFLIWKRVINECLNYADYVKNNLNSKGLAASKHLYSNQVVFKRPEETVVQKWQLPCLNSESKVTIMPNHKESHINLFINDLVSSSKTLNVY